jgi:hypothetical protein
MVLLTEQVKLSLSLTAKLTTQLPMASKITVGLWVSLSLEVA